MKFRRLLLGAGYHLQQAAEALRVLFVGSGFLKELDSVVVPATMPDNAFGPHRPSGKWRRKLDCHLVAGFQLHSGKDQNAAFTYVIAAAAHDLAGALIGIDQPDGHIEPVTLPAAENCSFLGRSQAWLRDRTKTRLCCHGTKDTFNRFARKVTEVSAFPILPERCWGT